MPPLRHRTARSAFHTSSSALAVDDGDLRLGAGEDADLLQGLGQGVAGVGVDDCRRATAVARHSRFMNAGARGLESLAPYAITQTNAL